MWILKTFKLIKWQENEKGIVICNNLTLINFVLINVGPLREPTLTSILMIIQVIYIYIHIFLLAQLIFNVYKMYK
jgi:UDP-N-acetylglucosamine--dolichyl-phosphate N-acetylglucosaminephosphotransferase